MPVTASLDQYTPLTLSYIHILRYVKVSYLQIFRTLASVVTGIMLLWLLWQMELRHKEVKKELLTHMVIQNSHLKRLQRQEQQIKSLKQQVKELQQLASLLNHFLESEEFN